eukprot:scaffold13798_cov122-Skeletonema_marinoi.AAC.1
MTEPDGRPAARQLHITSACSNSNGPPPIIIISLRKCCFNACKMNTAPRYQQQQQHDEKGVGEIRDGDGGYHYYYGSHDPYGDSLSAILASASSLIIRAMQAPLQPEVEVVQHGQAPSPQQQQHPISVVTMIPSSTACAWERSVPHYAYASYCNEASVQPLPQFYTPSHSLDGFMSQVHHLQPSTSISPPYMQHQSVPVQESLQYPSVYDVDVLRTLAPFPLQQVQLQTQAQAFSYDSFHRDSHQPSPQSDSDSSPRECSAKSPPRRKGKELHVRHLPSDMSEEELRDLFSQHGVVTRASIARHQSGKSRGYAFVKFKLQSAADNAIMRLDKYEVSIM